MSNPDVTVIGIGNEHRGDDGVGKVVVRQLQAVVPEMRVLEESGEGASLMDAWKDSSFVILVDAVRSGAAPGTIHRFDANAETIPESFFNYSTHGFSVAEAVEMARVLDQLPPRLLVFGIEGGNFDSGKELSPEVAAVVAPVIEQIQKETGNLPDP